MDEESKSHQPEVPARRKRTRLARPYPMHTLEDALGVGRAIQESNAGLPFDRVMLARALGTTASSSGFTMRLNSSAKYGLTQGGYNDERISLTPRGEAAVAAEPGGRRPAALLEGAMQPDLFGRFYRALDGKRLPEDAYARGILQREFGVHPDLVSECLGIIKSNGLFAGIFQEAGDRLSVSLDGMLAASDGPAKAAGPSGYGVALEVAGAPAAPPGVRPGGRIFIGHGASEEAVRFIREVLDGFGIAYSAARHDGSESQLLLDVVSEEMRMCNGAVLVLGGDAGDGEGSATMTRLLLQLGAALVLYGPRVVVVREGDVPLGGALAELRCVVFDRGRPHEAGLSLLKALHDAGVIKVQA